MFKERDRKIKSLQNLVKQKDAIINKNYEVINKQQKMILKLMESQESQQLRISFNAN